jgi:hypothetical protein
VKVDAEKCGAAGFDSLLHQGFNNGGISHVPSFPKLDNQVDARELNRALYAAVSAWCKDSILHRFA